MTAGRKVGVGLIVLGIALFGYFFYNLLQTDPAPTGGDETADLSTEFASARMVGHWKGERQWAMEAKVMNDSGDVVTLDSIENGVIYKENKEYLTFQAGRAVWEKRVNGKASNNLHLADEVVVLRDGRPVMTTAMLDWNASQSMLVAPETVSFDYDGVSVEAGRMVLDSAHDTITLEKDVHVLLKDGSVLTVGNRIVYNMESGEFTAYGPTTVEPAAENVSQETP